MSSKSIWAPQPGPQATLLRCPTAEILFGGARGGGKSDGLLGKFAIKQAHLGKAFNAIIFRREMPQADDLIARSHEIYRPLGAIFAKMRFQWTFPSGARLRFRPLESLDDAAKYQGQNLSDVGVEEAGNYPDPAPLDRLWGAIRGSAAGQLIMTANPGGPGQFWLKERFYDPWPEGNRILIETLPHGRQARRIYIPSKIEQNRMLLKKDPGYVDRLYKVGSAALVRAWLEGDWTAVEGAYFDNWSYAKHVIDPFELPESWTRFRSMDWGSASPFSVGWWAIVPDETKVRGRTLPKGALVRYREWYGSNPDRVNSGLKLTAEQVAQGILDREPPDEDIRTGVLDPAAFAEDGGPSIAERMARLGVRFRRADNKRTGRHGAMGGWDVLRERLRGVEGTPMIYCFSTCRESIRTLPVLQHDPLRPEDLDTEAEDHIADEWRYAVMSRISARRIEHEPPTGFKPEQPTFEEVRLENIHLKKNQERL